MFGSRPRLSICLYIIGCFVMELESEHTTESSACGLHVMDLFIRLQGQQSGGDAEAGGSR